MGRLCQSQTLTLVTNVGACCSFCFLFVSVITNYWLQTTETRTDDNGTFQVYIYSGLWKKCAQDSRSNHSVNCTYISYFGHVDKDGLGSTESILLSLRRAIAFPLMGLLLQLIAQMVCFLSHCSLRRQAMTIVSGVLYVAGGLFTLVGIIIYIGAITEEAGNKVKSSDDPKFKYNYGPSLFLAIASFVGSQMTGVLSVNLYISRKERDYMKSQELAAINAGSSNSSSSTVPVVSVAAVLPQESRTMTSSSFAATRNNKTLAERYCRVNADDVTTAGAFSWRGGVGQVGGGGGGGGGGCSGMGASPARSETFCTDMTISGRELSSYSFLSRDASKSTALSMQSQASDTHLDAVTMMTSVEDQSSRRTMRPEVGGRTCDDVRPALSREWSECSTTATRVDLSRQWSERSADARSTLSRDWSKCSTDELDSSSTYRRITPV